MFQKFKSKITLKSYTILYYTIYTIFCILFISIWTFWIAPKLKEFPTDFSYSAKILSIDNFYDETVRKFEGEHISKTTFQFAVVKVNPNYLTIKNSFDVSKLSNKPIFSVSRLYYVNPFNGAHVAVTGGENRVGWLFAPRYLSKNAFYYWHVNYDTPALMHFAGTETIDGLKVYRYTAHFTADQTENLTHLPGVPDKRGIKTDVRLRLWIEPVSGWLIRYQDNSLASFYDKKTGAMLSPWNRFSNRYTQNSIHEKITEARALKRKFLILDFGVPILILCSPLIIMTATYLRKKISTAKKSFGTLYSRSKSVMLTGIAWLLLTGAAIESVRFILWHKKPPATFTVGISEWSHNIELQAAVRGFIDGLADEGFQNGKNIRFIIKNPRSSIENQINIIQSFVHDNVDIIFTLTTPGTLVAKGITDKIPIVYTDVSYPVESGIENQEQPEKTNMVGTLNYISPPDQFFEFDTLWPHTKTLGFVRHKGDPDSEIQFQEYKNMLSRRGINVVDIDAIDPDDIQNRLTREMQQHPFNALFVACDTLMRGKGGAVAAEFSKNHRIASFTCDKNSVLQGVLLGYFADLYSLGKLAGLKAAMILQGADPGWLKTESPENGYLMINRSSADLLGITLPSHKDTEGLDSEPGITQ